MSVKGCHFVNQRGQSCGQPSGHMGNHGNGLLTSPRDEWMEPLTLATKKEENVSDYEMREGDYQCPWQGVTGRCLLRVGHFPAVPHREDTNVKENT